jgi:hypothetical protein
MRLPGEGHADTFAKLLNPALNMKALEATVYRWESRFTELSQKRVGTFAAGAKSRRNSRLTTRSSDERAQPAAARFVQGSLTFGVGFTPVALPTLRALFACWTLAGLGVGLLQAGCHGAVMLQPGRL